MAFLKRTWLARLGTGLNKFLIGEKGADGKQTLTNSPDTVVQEGDVISADNLNDLEDRISDGFDEKQDVLTFDNVPTSGSNNPVKSGGIYSAIKEVADDVTAMKLTKIWENPNPNTAYTATSFSDRISLNYASEFIIEYSLTVGSSDSHLSNVRMTAHFKLSPNSITVGESLHGNISHLSVGNGVQYVSCSSRGIRLSGGTLNRVTDISFTDCYLWKPSTSSVTVENTLLVPQVIYRVGDIYNS